MAKEQLNIPALQSWDEVDNCLREICECEIAMTTITAEMNIAINDAKEKAKGLHDPMQKRVTQLTMLVQSFVESARADIEGKSKVLNFGKVGFRQSSSVSVPTRKLDAIIKNLKEFGMMDCILTKETVNKEALEKYSDDDIAKVGASRKVEDRFFLEADREKVRR